MKTATFCIKGIHCVVKETFVKKYRNPEQLGDWYDLNIRYKITEYLHNEHGPALYSLGNAEAGTPAWEQYWINGVHRPDEGYRIKFNAKLDKLLDD